MIPTIIFTLKEKGETRKSFCIGSGCVSIPGSFTGWIVVDVFDGNLDGGRVGECAVGGGEGERVMLPRFVIEISRDFDFAGFRIYRENIVQVSGSQGIVELFH